MIFFVDPIIPFILICVVPIILIFIFIKVLKLNWFVSILIGLCIFVVLFLVEFSQERLLRVIECQNSVTLGIFRRVKPGFDLKRRDGSNWSKLQSLDADKDGYSLTVTRFDDYSDFKQYIPCLRKNIEVVRRNDYFEGNTEKYDYCYISNFYNRTQYPECGDEIKKKFE